MPGTLGHYLLLTQQVPRPTRAFSHQQGRVPDLLVWFQGLPEP